MGGMPVAPTWDQDSFQWYSDAGGEGTNGYGTNTNPTDLEAETEYRLRYLIQETNGTNQSPTPTIRLEFRVDPAGGTSFGSWAEVDSDNSNFDAVTASPVTDGGSTTQQIGAGTFVDGEFVFCDAGGSATNAMAAMSANGEYECEWVIGFATGSGGAKFEFRVTIDGVATDTAAQTTQVDVASAAITGTATQTAPGFSQAAAGSTTSAVSGTTSQWFDGGTRNNFMVHPNDLNGFVLGKGWYGDRGTAVSNDAVAPDGSTTASKWTDDGVSGNTTSRFSTTHRDDDTGFDCDYFNDNTEYVASIYAKYGNGASFVYLYTLNWTTPGNVFCWFDIENGTVGTQQSGLTGTITDVGDGWYRLEVKFTVGSVDRNGTTMWGQSQADGSQNYTLDGSYNWFWGAQFEKGGTATPLIVSTSNIAPVHGDNQLGGVNAASGVLEISGSAVQTVATPDQTAAGTHLQNPTGTAAQTAETPTQLASGTLEISGSAVQTAETPTQLAAGVETLTATAAQTVPDLSQLASGSLEFSGAANQTVPPTDQLASGVHVENPTGTATQTAETPTQTASGLLEFSGTAAQTAETPTQLASGVETFSATAVQTAETPTQTATGVHTSNDVAGSAVQTAETPTQVASGAHIENVTGTAAQTAETPTQLAAGEVTGVTPEAEVEYPTGLGAVADGPDFMGDPALVEDEGLISKHDRERNERRRRSEERLRRTLRRYLDPEDPAEPVERPAGADAPSEPRKRTRQEQKALEAAVKRAMATEGVAIDFGSIRRALRDTQIEIDAVLRERAAEEDDIETLLLAL